MQRLEWHCHTKNVSGALYKAILYHGQSAGKEMANSAVFKFRWNTGSEWISLTEVGREFQARDAAAVNARSPMVDRRVGGTTSVDVEADRRRRRPCTSAVNWSVSARYGVAVPWRQQCVRTHKRHYILSGTFNQCSSRRSGVMCSDLLAENTSRAAAFNTDCRRCKSALDTCLCLLNVVSWHCTVVCVFCSCWQVHLFSWCHRGSVGLSHKVILQFLILCICFYS